MNYTGTRKYLNKDDTQNVENCIQIYSVIESIFNHVKKSDQINVIPIKSQLQMNQTLPVNSPYYIQTNLVEMQTDYVIPLLKLLQLLPHHSQHLSHRTGASLASLQYLVPVVLFPITRYFFLYAVTSSHLSDLQVTIVLGKPFLIYLTMLQLSLTYS